jgi:hypothetical protein
MTYSKYTFLEIYNISVSLEPETSHKVSHQLKTGANLSPVYQLFFLRDRVTEASHKQCWRLYK